MRTEGAETIILAFIEGAAKRWLRRLKATVGVAGRAYAIYRDYARDLYFPSNRLSWAQRLRCAAPLLCIELLVYQVDALTEKNKSVELSMIPKEDYETLHRHKKLFVSLLRAARAYNSEGARHIEYGEEFVRLEHRVLSTQRITKADWVRLIELRSCDVRLLHSMMFAMLGRPCDQDLLDLLWPVEVLSDIANDFEHYADDVASGGFNVYAACVALYGPDDAPARIRALIGDYEQRYQNLLALYPAARQGVLDALCARRYRERLRTIPEVLPQPGYFQEAAVGSA